MDPGTRADRYASDRFVVRSDRANCCAYAHRERYRCAARHGNGGYPYRGDEAATLAFADYEAPTVPPPGPPPIPPPDERQLWPWLLAFLVLVLAGAGAAYGLSRGGGHHRVRPQKTVVVTRAAVPATTASKAKRILPMKAVPNVLGLPVARAVVLIEKPGFVAQKRLVASKRPNGTVVSQQPAPRSKLARGGAVVLAVSRGPGLAVLQGSKVRLNIASGAPAETATTTSTATRKAAAPTPAAVKVTVPDVEGLKLSAARTALRAVGLIVELRYVPSQLPASTVTGQSPKAGTSVKKGSHVFLTVSGGGSEPQRPQQQPQQQQQQTVPNVVGQDEATAQQTLQGAGFVVEAVDSPTTDPNKDGVVVDEQPAGETKAPSGSDVTIYIGRYSPSG